MFSFRPAFDFYVHLLTFPFIPPPGPPSVNFGILSALVYEIILPVFYGLVFPSSTLTAQVLKSTVAWQKSPVGDIIVGYSPS